MKMKHLALTLIFMAMATPALASGDSSSLFTCGINLGGKQLTYQSKSAEQSKKEYRARQIRMNHVIGAVKTEPTRLNLSQPANYSKTEKRLPPKVTFAIIGCSWR